jgi:hypothetical protein
MNRKQKRAQRTHQHPKLKPSKRQRKKVLTLTAEGKNRELVAHETNISIAKLRTDYASELDVGRKLAADKKAEESEAQALSMEDFHFLDVCTDSFNSHWQDPQLGNLLFAGTDGKDGRTIEDMFAAFKQRGGKWTCTGLSSKFDPAKAATFSKIASDYRNKFETR